MWHAREMRKKCRLLVVKAKGNRQLEKPR